MNNTKKINLLITVFDLHFGGISNLILQTTPALMKKMNVEIVYFGPKDQMLSRYLKAGICPTRIPYNGPKDILSATRKLVSFVKKNKIQVVSTQLPVDQVIVAFARLFTRFKILSTLHSANNPYPSINYSFYIKNKIEDFFHNIIANKTFAVSEASLASWINFRSFNNKNTKILYSGIESLPCTRHRTYQKENKEVIFVTACRFSPVKGLERLIKIFKDVDSLVDNWQFWIIGDGGLRMELEDLVMELNLQNKIFFHGFQTDICQFYKESDFYINSSYHEALGISIIEALSVGIPVIGSNVGGIPEIIDDRDNGFLIDFDNKKDGVNLIYECVTMKSDEYLEYSKNALDSFKLKFSINNYVDNFYNEMRILINKENE